MTPNVRIFHSVTIATYQISRLKAARLYSDNESYAPEIGLQTPRVWMPPFVVLEIIADSNPKTVIRGAHTTNTLLVKQVNNAHRLNQPCRM